MIPQGASARTRTVHQAKSSDGIITASVTSGPQPSASPLRRPRTSGQPSVARRALIAPPQRPRPPAQPSVGPPGVAKRAKAPMELQKPRIINIGIESEFELAPINQENKSGLLREFIQQLADNHNKVVPSRHPRMQNVLREYEYKGPYNKWCLVMEPAISGARSGEPWGIELVSPILKATLGSRWREDVEATWNYLKDHYHITTNKECSTHIHISLNPTYNGEEIKRIAQAIIHFEPALEALVPPIRRGNVYTKSNWLDSPSLQRANKSRSQLIDDIERANYASSAVRLMQNTDDRDYSWNFWSIYSKETIEFRKPPASTTAAEVLAWAEFAISFIQASILYEDTTLLQKIPPTIGGLRWFISRFTVPGVSEPKRMQRIWKGKDPKAMLEPLPNTSNFFPWEQKLKQGRVARLKEMAEYERKQNQQLVREAKEPYW